MFATILNSEPSVVNGLVLVTLNLPVFFKRSIRRSLFIHRISDINDVVEFSIQRASRS